MSAKDFIKVGEINGVFGVKGWVKVFSFTEPRENILNYSPWYLQRKGETKEMHLVGGQRQGKLVVAALEGVADRDAAAALIGWDILIDKEQLPVPEQGEYYWADLVGLRVETEQGEALGIVDHLMETGANDVLVVKDGKKERLIPFLQQQTVLNVDIENGLMIVDWDPDF
ncbi:ribosome maturation factor RimM [Methylomarinum vadi]|uniref:ribosome maturation factor RimM n=1 Tax=Methylomarinum vadi TaxID=438855 RepID=UPI0004DEDC4F|nr:ribosome maturation factor RimM [Methylomarinum vadi]